MHSLFSWVNHQHAAAAPLKSEIRGSSLKYNSVQMNTMQAWLDVSLSYFVPGWWCGQKAAGGQSITQSCSNHSNVNEPVLSQNVLMCTTIYPTGWTFNIKCPTSYKQRRFKQISQSLPLSYSSQILFLHKRPQSHGQSDQHFLCFRDKSPDLWMEGDNTFKSDHPLGV